MTVATPTRTADAWLLDAATYYLDGDRANTLLCIWRALAIVIQWWPR